MNVRYEKAIRGALAPSRRNSREGRIFSLVRPGEMITHIELIQRLKARFRHMAGSGPQTAMRMERMPWLFEKVGRVWVKGATSDMEINLYRVRNVRKDAQEAGILSDDLDFEPKVNCFEVLNF